MSLHVSNVCKRFGDLTILENVSFVLNAGERWGLIGPNGCGKTTLLRIIAGHEPADAGSVRVDRPDQRIGYLEQSLGYAESDSVAAMLMGVTTLERAERELAELATGLGAADTQEQERLIAAYADALTRLEQAAATQPAPHEVKAVLAGLGLDSVAAETPVATLSGGQKTRLGLARLLVQSPQVLLLDEPTNHLDIAALRWLEGWLRGYRGAVLVVSHDREFLDRTVTSLLELDPATHGVTMYRGSFADYVATKKRQRDQQWAAYKDQEEHIAAVNEEIRRLSNYARSIECGTIDFHIRKIAKGIAHRAVTHQRRLERELEREHVDKPIQGWQMKLDFGTAPASGQDVLHLQDLAIGYGTTPLLRDITQVVRAGERIALLGANGAGKTTLLRTISGALTPLAGSVRLGAHVRLGYFAQEGELLDPASTPLEIIRPLLAADETEVRSFLHYFLFAGEEVFARVGDLSFGERARLALARLVAAGSNLLLLDEPINHLDIPSRARFEQALAGFEGTVLAAVHDRYFVRQFATRIWEIEGGGLRTRLDVEDLG